MIDRNVIGLFFFLLMIDEIFQKTNLLFWSVDDRYLAYLKINLTNLSKNTFLKYDFNEENDDRYTIPYPKFNQSIPQISAHIYDTKTGKSSEFLGHSNTKNRKNSFLPSSSQNQIYSLDENPTFTSTISFGILLDHSLSFMVIVVKIPVSFNYTKFSTKEFLLNLVISKKLVED